jgi:type IV secretory pathway TrbD component
MDIPEIYCERFHESANRPDLIAGCEGSALGLLFVLTLILIICLPHWWGIAGSILLFLFLRGWLRDLAKKDPQFFAVYLESQRYNGGFWTAKPQTKRTWRTR